MGFEPTTSILARLRSTPELHPRNRSTLAPRDRQNRLVFYLYSCDRFLKGEPRRRPTFVVGHAIESGSLAGVLWIAPLSEKFFVVRPVGIGPVSGLPCVIEDDEGLTVAPASKREAR